MFRDLVALSGDADSLPDDPGELWGSEQRWQEFRHASKAWSRQAELLPMVTSMLFVSSKQFADWFAEARQNGPCCPGPALPAAGEDTDREWLIPMALADLANRLGNVGRKKARTMLKDYGLKQAGNRQLWTVRVDSMPANIRRMLEGKQ